MKNQVGIQLLWLFLLPVLTFSFSVENLSNQVESTSDNSTLKGLRCEHYDKHCIEQAIKEGIDSAKCFGIKKCETANEKCFVSWRENTKV